jgi:hypothetical protein
LWIMVMLPSFQPDARSWFGQVLVWSQMTCRSIKTITTVRAGWRSKLGKFVNSLPVALFVLACIVVDLTAGLVFEFQPGDAKDCKGRDSLESLAITWAVKLFSLQKLPMKHPVAIDTD